MAAPSSPASVSVSTAVTPPDAVSVSSSSGNGRNDTVCLLCRRRKVKCDRRKPSCGFCIKNGTAAQCRYTVTQKKHGLRAGYVSRLEGRLERLESEVKELRSQHSQMQARVPPYQRLHTNSQNPVDDNVNDYYISPTSPLPAIHVLVGDGLLSSLSINTLTELVTIWFDKYHRWFPILHHLSLLQLLHDASQGQQQNLEASPLSIVLKAITAVTLPHVGLSTMLSHAQRQGLSSTYRQDIAMQAMDQLSLPSLQAVLIITIPEFGDGKISKFWNLIALCKRMAMQLGLRDVVVNQFTDFNNPFALPPRMLPLPSTLIEQEERTRAYWMAEILDGSSAMGVAWNLSFMPALTPDPQSWPPSSDDVWSSYALPSIDSNSSSFFVSVASFSGDHVELSSSFALYASLVANELHAVHVFLQQPFDRRSAAGRAKWQTEAKSVDNRLQRWRTSSSLLGSFRVGSSGTNTIVTGEQQQPIQRTNGFDPIIVLVLAMFDTALITLYQRLAFPTPGLEEQHGPFYHAIQRCLDACDEITEVIRSVSDADLENMSPHVIFPIFVAARFFLVHAKLISVETPRNVDLLIYSLRVCGQRWNLARRLERVLRQAAAEREITISLTTLPPQFFDLQYSHLDIDKLLEVWADGQEGHGYRDHAKSLMPFRSQSSVGVGNMT